MQESPKRLPEPPQTWQPLRDFRSADQVGELTPGLRYALRLAHERRQVAVELYAGSADVASFDVTSSLDEDAEEFATRIRDALHIRDEAQPALETVGASLNFWRSAAEAQGVLVFGFPSVAVAEARGFSLSGQTLPVVGLNNNDSPTGRAFTLAHELAHVALRSGESLCDFSDDTSDPEVERFCNHVAGALLVPARMLLAIPTVRSADSSRTWSEAEASQLAREFRVSREVILRRLLILGRTNQLHYSDWRKLFAAEYEKYKSKMDEGTGGPDYATKTLGQLGRLYASLILSAYGRNAIRTSSASAHLGVKVQHFGSLAAGLSGSP